MKEYQGRYNFLQKQPTTKNENLLKAELIFALPTQGTRALLRELDNIQLDYHSLRRDMKNVSRS
jgi:hypothetical protein